MSAGLHPTELLLAKHADVVLLLRAGKSLRDVAARTGTGPSTVKRLKALLRAGSSPVNAQAAPFRKD